MIPRQSNWLMWGNKLSSFPNNLLSAAASNTKKGALHWRNQTESGPSQRKSARVTWPRLTSIAANSRRVLLNHNLATRSQLDLRRLRHGHYLEETTRTFHKVTDRIVMVLVGILSHRFHTEQILVRFRYLSSVEHSSRECFHFLMSWSLLWTWPTWLSIIFIFFGPWNHVEY